MPRDPAKDDDDDDYKHISLSSLFWDWLTYSRGAEIFTIRDQQLHTYHKH